MMKFLKRLAPLVASLLWLPTLALAQDCGAADKPCVVTDGSYHLMRPESDAPLGIVMHLHGGGGTGKGQMGSGLAKEALARGYVFVAPNGEHPENQWSKDWSVRADNMSFDRNDIVFLDDVLADVRTRTGLGDGPTLLAGFSRGGSMVWNMACYQPGFATAYAALAGAFWDALPARCDAPVRLFHTHGWTDRTVPLEGRSFGAMSWPPSKCCERPTAAPTASQKLPTLTAIFGCVIGAIATPAGLTCFCTKVAMVPQTGGPKS